MSGKVQMGVVAAISFLCGCSVGPMLGILEYQCEVLRTTGEEKKSCTETTTTRNPRQDNDSQSPIGKSVWDVAPFEHTDHVEFIKDCTTDAFNPFSNYFYNFWEGIPGRQAEAPELPVFSSWPHYLEAYHNHFHRFRNKNVTFMEAGVQFGGKIWVLRDYFGPGLTYIGVDVSPTTKLLETADWIHIEIGDMANRDFLRSVKEKHPHVDIFLDDGGHQMIQQRVAIEEMLPHVQPEGVYVCEDMSTSWRPPYHGIPNGNVHNQRFRDETMMGYVHNSIDWLHAHWFPGKTLNPGDDQPDLLSSLPPLARVIHDQVKHIHIYDQQVVYEKGVSMVPRVIDTVGSMAKWVNAPPDTRDKAIMNGTVDWQHVLNKVQNYTHSPWNW